MDKKPIIAYQTNDKTVFGPLESWEARDTKANGEELVATYLSNFYQVEGKLESLVELSTRVSSTRYELKNKALYNERIPLIIDETTKEIYKELVGTELYQCIQEYEEVLTPIPFKVKKVDASYDNVSDLSSRKTWSSWKSEWVPTYYIDLVEFSIVDQCLVPRPLLDFTRPCAVGGDVLYTIIRDTIAKHKLPIAIRITDNEKYQFKVINVKSNTHVFSFKGSMFEKKWIVAKNYEALKANLNAFVEVLIKQFKDEDAQRECSILLDDFLQGKDFTKEVR